MKLFAHTHRALLFLLLCFAFPAIASPTAPCTARHQLPTPTDTARGGASTVRTVARTHGALAGGAADALITMPPGAQTTAAPDAKFVQTTYYSCVTLGTYTHCGWHEPILDATNASAAGHAARPAWVLVVGACLAAALGITFLV